MVWAHSTNAQGCRHRLDEHLRSTGQLAAEFAEPFGLSDVARWAGLVHDAGKAWCSWQTKLLAVEPTGGRVGLDHKSFGVHLARQHGLRMVEWVVAGHHGGLGDYRDLDDLLGVNDPAKQAERQKQWTDAERALKALVPEIFEQPPAVPPEFANRTDRLAQEFLVRFLFSCLVDADVLDTQAHRLGLATPRSGVPFDAEMLVDRLLKRRRVLLADRLPSPMDGLRSDLFEAALSAADMPPGVFLMTAPTGAAKTMAAAGFALRHAARHGKRRVIVAVPFITITEQNAAVYRQLLDDGDDVVLEHHSNVDWDVATPGRGRVFVQRMAAENWDAPFIVTTTVQLLESLFGRKPSAMRKVHRVAGSVVVLDEVQALPHRLLPQVADALRILTSRFGVTVLLSTATQPAWGELNPLKALRAHEIVPDVAAVFRSAQRVRFEWRTDPRPTLASVTAEVVAYRQALVVVNTVRDARTLYELAQAKADAGVKVLHLSTGMCPLHRTSVLTRVRQLLDERAPVVLVSTSLVEAGVDLDFPVAFRALAPPESIGQVAGRCNRSGWLGTRGGLVVIFDPVDGGAPPSFGPQVGNARVILGPDRADPEDVDALAAYFATLYRSLDIDGPASVSAEIRKNRRRWDFHSVTDGPQDASGRRDRRRAFRMILDDTVPVVVSYGTRSDLIRVCDALAELRGPAPHPDAWRRLQPNVTEQHRAGGPAVRGARVGATAGSR
ncbi:CRISPR-associated helicase Cas3' [Virgisporangium aurantiacum]|uniref:CRISPR-associated helicase/endonuclease Cas3 n=1 Tax=Virgisporangium aurantiacum TaxID=175570 RepID=A0A8J3ZMH3_9ACTN|nr:CRISPR-associated helicase Cas3' [Virgisporangium aurantiacum]GIJ64680.1 CRISPR-associated helicase/endonuclease Cas3 [Virgisporangium aurantiacum]